jgi:hypothetical protein
MRARKSVLWLTFSIVLLATALAYARVDQAQPKFRILHRVGGSLFSGLTFDVKGNLYGATAVGGPHNESRIFELTRSTSSKWSLSIVHNFYGPTDGCGPNGGLIFDVAGNMYGTTSGCGTNQGGTVFEVTPGSDGWSLKVLHEFGSPEEATGSSVVLDKAGNLYGIAGGGTYAQGVAYELSPTSGSWKEKILHNFGHHLHDANPTSSLVFDKVGNLYGVGVRGGTYYQGAVYELRRGSGGKWTERMLHSFDDSDGQWPYFAPVFGPDGNLYGTTFQGGSGSCGETNCGLVYKLTPTSNGSWQETVLYEFQNFESGGLATSGVVFDKAGNLYGTAGGGSGPCPNGCGVVYKLTPGAGGKWKYMVLHRFNSTDGSMPVGGLVLDDKGNLYGTAFTVVFEITP